MIDWITCKVPCSHVAEIHDGGFISHKANGEIEWTTKRRKKVKGSFESGLQIRTDHFTAEPCTHLEISGNPTKWFQGHNLWGTDDLPGLLIETLQALVKIPQLQLTPTSEEVAQWLSGGISLSRVDVTQSYSLGNRGRVLEWLRAAEQSAHLPFRGRGQLVKGSTLYFGKNSRRWSLKLYSKGQEMEAPGHGQEAVLSLPAASAWADGILRAELTLRGLELERRGLRTVASWLPVDGLPFDACAMLTSHLGGVTMTTASSIPPETLEALTSFQRTAYLSWLAGNDLRATISKAAFYKLRAKLLPHGVDIATLIPVEKSNVVPMVRILEAVPVGVPEWAVGTPLYFEPRRLRIA